jgi:SAM-dependent methyltransferase
MNSATQRMRRIMPGFLSRYILHFEASIEDAVNGFAAQLPLQARVLDAGAGEVQFAPAFAKQRYVAVDLGIGDTAWNYGSLDAMADLEALPFADGCFKGCLNIVTLEHVREPGHVIGEMFRILSAGGSILLVVPHEWEEHQEPHDFFRYTRYGMEYLLKKAGFVDLSIEPVGGYFRLLARRLLNGLQFFPTVVAVPAALLVAPVALVLPLLDGLDKRRNFTLGYICTARKP